MQTIQITLCVNYYTLIAVLALCITAIICTRKEKKAGGKCENEEF